VVWTSPSLSRHLAVNAFTMALDQRRPGDELIHHSDRGVQHMSDDFQALLKTNGITCSMSGKGSCYDNAVVESFFASLKRERTSKEKIPHARRSKGRSLYLDGICNGLIHEGTSIVEASSGSTAIKCQLG